MTTVGPNDTTPTPVVAAPAAAPGLQQTFVADAPSSDDVGGPDSILAETANWWGAKFSLQLCGQKVGADGAKRMIMGMGALLLVMVVYIASGGGGSTKTVIARAPAIKTYAGGNMDAQLALCKGCVGITRVQGTLGASPYLGKVAGVRTQGVVTAVTNQAPSDKLKAFQYGFFMQDGLGPFGDGSFSGIYVYAGSRTRKRGYYFAPKVGDKVTINARVEEVSGFTEMYEMQKAGTAVVSKGNPTPEPTAVSTAKIGGPYESVRVRVTGMCTSESLGTNGAFAGQWTLDDASNRAGNVMTGKCSKAFCGVIIGNLLLSQMTVQRNHRYTVIGIATFRSGVWMVDAQNIKDECPSNPALCSTANSNDIPRLKIHQLQGPGGLSPYMLQQVTTSGIVTTVIGWGFFIQDGRAPFYGMFVYTGGRKSYAKVAVGDRIAITATVVEYKGLTELNPSCSACRLVVLGSGARLPRPITLTTSKMGESYESVRIALAGTCTKLLGYGEFVIDDGTGPVIIDDLFIRKSVYKAYTPAFGLTLTKASVTWRVQPWLVSHGSGPAQKSPNFAPVVAEAMSMRSWPLAAKKGNLFVVITGVGRRVAASFDGVNSNYASFPPTCKPPTLVINGQSFPIAHGIDDMEQFQNDNGSRQARVYADSQDLEMVNDGGDQNVGLLFRNLPFGRNTKIKSAYVQFCADEPDSKVTTLQIQAFAGSSGGMGFEPRLTVVGEKYYVTGVGYSYENKFMVEGTTVTRTQPPVSNLQAALDKFCAGVCFGQRSVARFDTGNRYQKTKQWRCYEVASLSFKVAKKSCVDDCGNQIMCKGTRTTQKGKTSGMHCTRNSQLLTRVKSLQANTCTKAEANVRGNLLLNGALGGSRSSLPYWAHTPTARLSFTNVGGRYHVLKVADNGAWSDIYQHIHTVKGDEYLVKFDVWASPIQPCKTADSNGIMIVRDGQIIGSKMSSTDPFKQGQGHTHFCPTTAKKWVTVSGRFTAKSASTTIGLHSEGKYSAYFDNVIVSSATQCHGRMQNGHVSYCSVSCPCGQGEGDCDVENQNAGAGAPTVASDCKAGLTCKKDIGQYFGMQPSFDVCVSSTWKPLGSCHGTLKNGHVTFCSKACPCNAGEGDCDGEAAALAKGRDNDCAAGLICKPNIGAYFGFQPSYDVCVSRSWTAGSTGLTCHGKLKNGHLSYCTKACPCAQGEGDCDQESNHSDCAKGLKCKRNIGGFFGMPAGFDMCVSSTWAPPGGLTCHGSLKNGHVSYCKPNCKCGAGEGDCDGETDHSDCKAGLICRPNVGAQYKMPASYDVCVKPQ